MRKEDARTNLLEPFTSPVEDTNAEQGGALELMNGIVSKRIMISNVSPYCKANCSILQNM